MLKFHCWRNFLLGNKYLYLSDLLPVTCLHRNKLWRPSKIALTYQNQRCFLQLFRINYYQWIANLRQD